MFKEFKELANKLPNGYNVLPRDIQNAKKRIVLSKEYDDDKYSSSYDGKKTVMCFSLGISLGVC